MLKTDFERRKSIFNSFVQKAASKVEEGEEGTTEETEEENEYKEEVYYNKEGELEINKENRSQSEIDSDKENEKE